MQIAYPFAQKEALPPFSPRVKGVNLIHHFYAFDALSASSVIFHRPPPPAPVAARALPLLMARKIEYSLATNLKGCYFSCPLVQQEKSTTVPLPPMPLYSLSSDLGIDSFVCVSRSRTREPIGALSIPSESEVPRRRVHEDRSSNFFHVSECGHTGLKR